MSRFDFKLPDVGEGLSEGEIVRWCVALGETVKLDQILAEVQTDKAIVEIPAPVAGKVAELGGKVGEILPIGAVLVSLEVDGTVPAQGGHGADHTAAASSSAVPAAATATPAAPPSNDGKPKRVKASPATRKLAVELNIDLSTVPASGSRGQVTRADIEKAAAAPVATSSSPSTPSAAAKVEVAAPVGEDRVEPLRGLRRQIAQSMAASWSNIPHIWSMDDIDATGLVEARRSINEDLAADGKKLSYLPFFVKACVAALKAHPRFNASLDLDGGQIIYRHRYNIGIATAAPDGLIVSVVHDADKKSLVEIADTIEMLAGLARERRIGVEQISGGTFTISNYGSYGGHMGTPIIRPPEVGIAGFGRIEERCVPENGQAVVRTRLPICLSADHRLNDGEHLGSFMNTMCRYLRNPVRLLATG